MKIARLNHAVLFVSDLARSLAFYEGVMGFEVVAREPRANAAFLRVPESENHHDLGLFGLGAMASPKQRGQVGLYHLAWQVPTIDDLASARTALLEAGALGGESDHGATKSLYGADPDGKVRTFSRGGSDVTGSIVARATDSTLYENWTEIMWMLPRNAWGEHESQAIVAQLDLDSEVERWSGVSTA